MEEPMKKSKPPRTDSIQKLAEFWDTHDLTDFEHELQEVPEPVFVRGSAINVPLEPRDIAVVERLARSKGVSPAQLVRSWVLRRITRRNNSRPVKRSQRLR
jgi:hypothetical protein